MPGREHLPAPARQEQMQGVRGRVRSKCKECGGARSAGAGASSSISASGANARCAGAQYARTSASGAYARSAARRRTRRCRLAWRSSRGQRMPLVKTCDLSSLPTSRTLTRLYSRAQKLVRVRGSLSPYRKFLIKLSLSKLMSAEHKKNWVRGCLKAL